MENTSPPAFYPVAFTLLYFFGQLSQTDIVLFVCLFADCLSHLEYNLQENWDFYLCDLYWDSWHLCCCIPQCHFLMKRFSKSSWISECIYLLDDWTVSSIYLFKFDKTQGSLYFPCLIDIFSSLLTSDYLDLNFGYNSLLLRN
jgi:hypothetical protein